MHPQTKSWLSLCSYVTLQYSQQTIFKVQMVQLCIHPCAIEFYIHYNKCLSNLKVIKHMSLYICTCILCSLYHILFHRISMRRVIATLYECVRWSFQNRLKSVVKVKNYRWRTVYLSLGPTPVCSHMPFTSIVTSSGGEMLLAMYWRWFSL